MEDLQDVESPLSTLIVVKTCMIIFFRLQKEKLTLLARATKDAIIFPFKMIKLKSLVNAFRSRLELLASRI